MSTATRIGKEAVKAPLGLADGVSANVSQLVSSVSDRISDMDLPAPHLRSVEIPDRLKDLPDRIRDVQIPDRLKPERLREVPDRLREVPERLKDAQVPDVFKGTRKKAGKKARRKAGAKAAKGAGRVVTVKRGAMALAAAGAAFGLYRALRTRRSSDEVGAPAKAGAYSRA